jgi:hypothetical protein
MKHALLFSLFLIFSFSNAFPDQLPKDHNERVQEMAKEGYNLIDTIFDNASASLAKKEELMDEQWLSKQKEIRAIQNLLSDSTIIFTFDENRENPIPKMLATYVQDKINEKIPSIFEIDRISIKRVEDFYEFSHTMCKLNGTIHCNRLMRKLESDHFDKILQLKAQKIARKQWRKENAQQLRDALLFGARDNQ